MTIPRLFVDAPLAVAAVVNLEDAPRHYLKDVLRLERSAEIRLFNGRDGEWRATIVDYRRAGVALACSERLRPPLDPETEAAGPWLAFAPIKRRGMEFLVEKATELGAARLLPVWTQRSGPTRLNEERLRAIAIEATEQCERLAPPEIAPAQTLESLLAAWPGARRLFACVEREDAVALGAAATQERGQAAGFLIGPEGGWTDAERALLTRRDGVCPVGLGPRILRAETAALAALACWQALAGDGVQG